MYSEILNNTYHIFVGQNQKENDWLVRNTIEPALWFHVDGISSPHGILIGINDTSYDKQAIYRTACLVKRFSKASKEHNTRVQYTDLENIQTTSKEGLVQLKKSPKIIKV